MADAAAQSPDSNWAARMHSFRSRLAAAGVTVALDAALPLPAQLAQLQDAAIDALQQRTTVHALDAQQEWLRVTLTSIGDAVITTDTVGRVTFLNPAAERLTGWRMAEAAGQPIQRVFARMNEATRQTAEDIVGRVLRDGQVIELAHHTALVSRQGEEIAIADSAAPIMDATGHIIGVVLVLPDVTERRRVQEALRQSEAKLRRLYESGMIGVLDYRADGAITDANDTFLAMVGYTRADLQAGRIDWARMTPPEYDAADAYAREELRTSGVDTPYVKEYYRKDGSRVPIFIGAATTDEARKEGIAFVLDITAQQRAQAAVQDSEARYRTLFSSMTEGFAVGEAILDKTGRPVNFRFLECNEAFTLQSGLPRSILGTPITEVLPHLEQVWIDHYTGVAVSGKAVRFVAYNQDTQRHFDVYCYCPQPGRFAILFRDLTMQRRIEEALRESEARYRELFETMQEALFVIEVLTDAEGNPVDWRYVETNPQVERYMGMTREQLVGHTYSAVVSHPDPAWIRLLGTIALTGRPVSQEMYAPTRGRWLQVNAYSPRPRQTAVLFTDITEKKRAEEALRLSEERYRELVQNANSAIIRWNADGALTFFNEYAQSFFGYTEEEVFGKSVDILMPAQESTGGNLAGLVQDIVAHPERYVYTVNENVRKDGSRAWMAWTNKPIFDASGRLTEILAVGADITALHEAQERERRYLYTLAHNLRAPATIIKGNLELLQEELQAAACAGAEHPLFEALQRGLARMTTLVDDFYMATCLEEGALTMACAPVALSTFLPEFLRESQLLLETERIRLVLPPDLPAVLADARHLHPVLVNLLVNALKFSEAPAPVRVSAHQQAEEVVISINDKGIGIAEEDLPRLFDRFYRIEHIRRAEGTGLGLYIAKRLVEAQGGRLWVESAPGQGSSFFFSLPAAHTM